MLAVTRTCPPHAMLVGLVVAGGVRVRHRACLLVPKENTRDGIVVESLNSIDDAATFPVRCHVSQILQVLRIVTRASIHALIFRSGSLAPFQGADWTNGGSGCVCVALMC